MLSPKNPSTMSSSPSSSTSLTSTALTSTFIKSRPRTSIPSHPHRRLRLRRPCRSDMTVLTTTITTTTTMMMMMMFLLHLLLLLPSSSAAAAAAVVSAETVSRSAETRTTRPSSSFFLRGNLRRRGLELSPPYWWSINNQETDDYDYVNDYSDYNDNDNDNATNTRVDNNDNDNNGNEDGNLIAPSYDDSAADAARGTNNFSDSDSDSDASNDDEDEGVSRKLGIVIFLIATIVSLSLITSMIVREYYFRLYGFDLCCCLKFTNWITTKRRQSGRVDDDNNNNNNGLSSSSSSPRGNNNNSGTRNDGSQQQEQFDADRALAVELQRQLNEEDRETYRLTKRDERRKWYEYYMKDRCMVVKDEDLFYGQEASDSQFLEVEECQEDVKVDEDVDDRDIDRDPSTNDIERAILPLSNPSRISLGDTSEDDFTTDDEMEFVGGCGEGSGRKSKSQRRDHLPTICDKDDEDAHLYLKMPTDRMNKENACLFVDGECALCIDEYEAGDQVAWSDLQCRHAFHKQCIMQWLSKGKKRCPICRNWFVPGARIEDQKKEHGEAWTAALAEMEKQEPGDESSTVEVNNESTDDIALTNSLDVSLAPSATSEEHRVIEDGNAPQYGEVLRTPTDMSSESSAVNSPLPQRKETDCTNRTSATMHTDESESSSSNHQSFDIMNDSSFEEPAITSTNDNHNTSPVGNEDA